MLIESAPVPVAETLTAALYGPGFADEHAFWRRLITTEPFRTRRHGAGPDERLSVTYDRLRLLNGCLDNAARLAADPRSLAALHEWISPVDPSLATVAGIHYNLFLGSLLDHDPDGVRDLSDYLAMDTVGTFLCTELAHGNDATSLGTTATYDPERDGFVLHTPRAGAQKFMPNTGVAGGPKSGVVAARLLVDGTDHGVFLFLAPLTDGTAALPGVRVRRLPARLGSPVDHCLTAFDQYFVERSALLAGEQGRVGEGGEFTSGLGSRRRRFLVSIGRVTPGKLCMSGATVGSARLALAVAVRYAGHRTISGSRHGERVPVHAHRTHHGPLAQALATTYAISLLHRRALDLWAGCSDEDREGAERLVAVAKGWITWQARGVIVESRERCGAQGLLENNGIAELLTGVEGAITAEGDNVAVHAKAAAELLFTDPDPLPFRDRVPGDLADPLFLRALVAAVESVHYARARRRMTAAPPGDPLRRWNAAAGPALLRVEAHACRQAAEAYADAVAALPPGEARDRLAELERLFLLRWVSRNAGDLLASGRMTADQVDLLPDLLETAVAAVAAHARTLVDAFAFPEEVFADRPIAGPGYMDVYDDPDGPWHRASGGAEEGGR